MSTMVSETKEGRELLGRLNDQWLTARAFGWGKIGILAAATTYPQWSSVFFRILEAFYHG